jgi:hypothetical protein
LARHGTADQPIIFRALARVAAKDGNQNFHDKVNADAPSFQAGKVLPGLEILQRELPWSYWIKSFMVGIDQDKRGMKQSQPGLSGSGWWHILRWWRDRAETVS